MNNTISEKRKHIFQNKSYVNVFIFMLMIFMIGSPFALWGFRLWYGGTHIDENIVYENSWLGFFGSYLGGVLGGGATLLALVSTINNSKKEQDRKEENEKQKVIQRSAFIIYLDFQFTFENIIEFYFQFWEKDNKIDNLQNAFYNSLYSSPIFNQFYFDYKWIHRVADLSISSEFEEPEIKKIGEIYGHLMNIKIALDKKNNYSCKKAFASMDSLVDFERLHKVGYDNLHKVYEQLKEDGKLNVNKAIESIMIVQVGEIVKRMEGIAFNKKEDPPQETATVTDILDSAGPGE